MIVFDEQFVVIVEVNLGLCVCVGNFDELCSNKFDCILDVMKYWVYEFEFGVVELIIGVVIIVFNEEVVVCVVFGNKGGLNLVVIYEVFVLKMFGVVCQELIFVCYQVQVG